MGYLACGAYYIEYPNIMCPNKVAYLDDYTYLETPNIATSSYESHLLDTPTFDNSIQPTSLYTHHTYMRNRYIGEWGRYPGEDGFDA